MKKVNSSPDSMPKGAFTRLIFVCRFTSAVDDIIGRAFKRPTFDLDILISFEMNCCTDCVTIVTQSPHERREKMRGALQQFIADWLLLQ